MKQTVKTLLFMLLLLNYFVIVFASAPNDIEGHWAENIIIEWQNSGKVSGYEDNTFRPDYTITRAEFVHLLNTIIPIEESTEVQFADVSTEDWFYDDISKAVANHIIAGFEDNTFRPNDKITRAQSAVIISNALELTNNENETKIVITDDDDIPEWSKSAVYAMLNLGYLSGYEDGSFGANRNMTRAEAISTLYRVEKNNQLLQDNIEILENTNDNTIYEDKSNIITKNTFLTDKSKITYISKNNHSHSSKDTKDSDSEQSKEVTIITKDNVSYFYGKAIDKDVIIELDEDSIILHDIIFTGNVEIISKTETDIMPTLYLEGKTNIKYMKVSTPISIESENNIIGTLAIKEKINISGNTEVYKLIIDKKGSIDFIHLSGNTKADIIIDDYVTVENITLSENAQCHIIVKEYGVLKEFISLSEANGSSIDNYGTIETTFVLNIETVTTKNVMLESAFVQNITILSQPTQLHYKEGDMFSLEGISLLLHYQNNITKVVNNIDDFAIYHIKTIPTFDTILTANENNKPITISVGDVFINTDLLQIDSVLKPYYHYVPPKEEDNYEEILILKEKLDELLIESRDVFSKTLISNTGEGIASNQYYIDEGNYYAFENVINSAQKAYFDGKITKKELKNQYDTLQTTFDNFKLRRKYSSKWIEKPIISVSNTTPEYGEENVIFGITDMQENTEYYYTLDGSEPSTESEKYIEPVVLSPSDDITGKSITIKAIAIESEFYSEISEQIVTYLPAKPINNIVIEGIVPPSTNQEITNLLKNEILENVDDISLEEEQEQENKQYIIKEFFWRDENKKLDDGDLFEPEIVYTAEITLEAKKPYIFKINQQTEDEFIEEINEEQKEQIRIILDDVAEEKIKKISIDESNSDIDTLHIQVEFQPTLPVHTQDMAEKELERLTPIITTEIFVPVSKAEDEKYCINTIIEVAQNLVSEYWKVSCELNWEKRVLSVPNKIIITGTFTVMSETDDSIFAQGDDRFPINVTVNIIPDEDSSDNSEDTLDSDFDNNLDDIE